MKNTLVYKVLMKRLCLLFALLPWLTLHAQDLSYGTKLVIHSEILDEDRTCWINLPTSYDDPNFGPQKYPVIYVMDGTSNFFPLAGLVNFMNMGLKYHPKSPYLHEKLGVAYEMKDEPQRALESYEEALRLNPENEELKEKLAQLKKQ